MPTFHAETPDGTLTWSNGALTGTPALVASISSALFGLGTIAATPTGPFVPRDTRDPVAVVAALSEMYPARVKLSGDVPDMDFGVPDGAVA